MSLVATIVARDLRLAFRRPSEALLPVAFFTVAIALFPLGVGPEPQTLRAIAPGVVWVAALLAALLSVTQLYERDHADGSLEQMVLAAGPRFPFAVALAKALAHWLLTGLPLALVSPVFGTMLGLPLPAIGLLKATLWLGTPTLSLLGGLGAALTVGLRGGPALLVLLVVPLAVPALVFGAGAVAAFESGLAVTGHLALLAAFFLATALVALPATAGALRIATE